MFHPDTVTIFRREKCRREGNVANVSASYLTSARHALQVEIATRRVLGPYTLPDPQSIFGIRKWKLDGALDAAHKGLVHVLSKVCRQDDNPIVLFHLLQQVVD